jgi:nickel superoxide dismutase
MTLASRLLSALDRISAPAAAAAHCDVPCGIYDPEQARIEIESCLKIIQKYHDSSDEVFRQRCVLVKEERAQIGKHHISVLWSDWYKPEKHGEEHAALFKRAVGLASSVKHSMDAANAEELLRVIDEIDKVFIAGGGLETNRVNGRPGSTA